jgi:hypothetical protein
MVSVYLYVLFRFIIHQSPNPSSILFLLPLDVGIVWV